MKFICVLHPSDRPFVKYFLLTTILNTNSCRKTSGVLKTYITYALFKDTFFVVFAFNLFLPPGIFTAGFKAGTYAG